MALQSQYQDLNTLAGYAKARSIGNGIYRPDGTPTVYSGQTVQPNVTEFSGSGATNSALQRLRRSTLHISHSFDSIHTSPAGHTVWYGGWDEGQSPVGVLGPDGNQISALYPHTKDAAGFAAVCNDTHVFCSTRKVVPGLGRFSLTSGDPVGYSNGAADLSSFRQDHLWPLDFSGGQPDATPLVFNHLAIDGTMLYAATGRTVYAFDIAPATAPETPLFSWVCPSFITRMAASDGVIYVLQNSGLFTSSGGYVGAYNRYGELQYTMGLPDGQKAECIAAGAGKLLVPNNTDLVVDEYDVTGQTPALIRKIGNPGGIRSNNGVPDPLYFANAISGVGIDDAENVYIYHYGKLQNGIPGDEAQIDCYNSSLEMQWAAQCFDWQEYPAPDLATMTADSLTVYAPRRSYKINLRQPSGHCAPGSGTHFGEVLGFYGDQARGVYTRHSAPQFTYPFTINGVTYIGKCNAAKQVYVERVNSPGDVQDYAFYGIDEESFLQSDLNTTNGAWWVNTALDGVYKDAETTVASVAGVAHEPAVVFDKNGNIWRPCFGAGFQVFLCTVVNGLPTWDFQAANFIDFTGDDELAFPLNAQCRRIVPFWEDNDTCTVYWFGSTGELPISESKPAGRWCFRISDFFAKVTADNVVPDTSWGTQYNSTYWGIEMPYDPDETRKQINAVDVSDKLIVMADSIEPVSLSPEKVRFYCFTRSTGLYLGNFAAADPGEELEVANLMLDKEMGMRAFNDPSIDRQTIVTSMSNAVQCHAFFFVVPPQDAIVTNPVIRQTDSTGIIVSSIVTDDFSAESVYIVVVTVGSTPTEAQVIAGSGGGIVAASEQVYIAGTDAVETRQLLGGLTHNTAYEMKYVVGPNGNVRDGNSFTTVNDSQSYAVAELNPSPRFFYSLLRESAIQTVACRVSINNDTDASLNVGYTGQALDLGTATNYRLRNWFNLNRAEDGLTNPLVASTRNSAHYLRENNTVTRFTAINGDSPAPNAAGNSASFPNYYFEKYPLRPGFGFTFFIVIERNDAGPQTVFRTIAGGANETALSVGSSGTTWGTGSAEISAPALTADTRVVLALVVPNSIIVGECKIFINGVSQSLTPSGASTTELVTFPEVDYLGEYPDWLIANRNNLFGEIIIEPKPYTDAQVTAISNNRMTAWNI
jgi:hypothetical protein